MFGSESRERLSRPGEGRKDDGAWGCQRGRRKEAREVGVAPHRRRAVAHAAAAAVMDEHAVEGSDGEADTA